MDWARAPLCLSGSPLTIQGGILQAARLTLLDFEAGPVALRPRLPTGLPLQENDSQLWVSARRPPCL